MRNTIRKTRVERPLRKLRHLKPTIDKGEREKKGGGNIHRVREDAFQKSSEKMHLNPGLICKVFPFLEPICKDWER